MLTPVGVTDYRHQHSTVLVITAPRLVTAGGVMRTERSAGAGLGLALLSAATFGTSGTFARSLIDAGWSAEAAVDVRIGIAAATLAVVGVLARRGRWAGARRSSGWIGLFGLLAVAG